MRYDIMMKIVFGFIYSMIVGKKQADGISGISGINITLKFSFLFSVFSLILWG